MWLNHSQRANQTSEIFMAAKLGVWFLWIVNSFADPLFVYGTSRWRLITGARGEGLSIGVLIISNNLQYTPSLNFIWLLRVIFSSQCLKWNEIQATVYPFCWNFTISQIFSWRFLWKFKQQKAITQSIQELRAFSRKMLIWLGLEFDE